MPDDGNRGDGAADSHFGCTQHEDLNEYFEDNQVAHPGMWHMNGCVLGHPEIKALSRNQGLMIEDGSPDAWLQVPNLFLLVISLTLYRPASILNILGL